MNPTDVDCASTDVGQSTNVLTNIDNAPYETKPIKRVTRAGIELADGRVDELDVLVCATGFDGSFHYSFDVVGRGGITLNQRWSPYAEAYLSLAVDGFPNMFLVYGPGSGLNTASILVLLESQVQYCISSRRCRNFKWSGSSLRSRRKLPPRIGRNIGGYVYIFASDIDSEC